MRLRDAFRAVFKARVSGAGVVVLFVILICMLVLVPVVIPCQHSVSLKIHSYNCAKALWSALSLELDGGDIEFSGGLDGAFSRICGAAGLPRSAVWFGSGGGESGAPAWEILARIPRNSPPDMPIAWTRGLGPDGAWDASGGVFGDSGGHIVFFGGKIEWRETLFDDDGRPVLKTSKQARLHATSGRPCSAGKATYCATDSAPVLRGVRICPRQTWRQMAAFCRFF